MIQHLAWNGTCSHHMEQSGRSDVVSVYEWVSTTNDLMSNTNSENHETSFVLVIQHVTYRVSQKKVGLVFRAHFRGFNGLKSKSGSPETPLKIQFYLLGSVFSPVYNLYTPVYTMYTMLVSGIISSTSFATVQNQIFNRFIIPFHNLQTDLKTPPSR